MNRSPLYSRAVDAIRGDPGTAVVVAVAIVILVAITVDSLSHRQGHTIVETVGTTTTTATGTYYRTAPSGQAVAKSGPSPATELPRAAAFCSSSIIRSSIERRPYNYPANNTMGDGTYTWSHQPYWPAWDANLARVQGAFTGTTTEMFSWAACRWGIDENTLRAIGVQESHWHQNAVGDVCGPVGEASYGIIQIKNKYCSGAPAWGGYPDTLNSTALALDFYGAYLRSCYDGDFYDGGTYRYGGKTVAQIAAANGWSYVLWGCIGAWFSGGWYDSGAQNYISGIKSHLANKDWLNS